LEDIPDSDLHIDDNTELGGSGMTMAECVDKARSLIALRLDSAIYYASMVENTRRGRSNSFFFADDVKAEIEASENDLVEDERYWPARQWTKAIKEMAGFERLALETGRPRYYTWVDSEYGRAKGWTPADLVSGLDEALADWPEFAAKFVEPLREDIEFLKTRH